MGGVYQLLSSIRHPDMTVFLLDFLKKWHHQPWKYFFKDPSIKVPYQVYRKLQRCKVPIYKKGNYRPVSLTCIFVVKYSIFKHIRSFNILCDEQHGFCHNRAVYNSK